MGRNGASSLRIARCGATITGVRVPYAVGAAREISMMGGVCRHNIP
jgi:hypothetical protein